MFEEVIRQSAARSDRLKVPDFPGSVQFLPSPLSFKDQLKNKVCILFFWDHRNVYCHHGIGWLKRLSSRIDDPRLAIVGIHVGGDSASLERALQRFDIPYPQLHDQDGNLARAFSINACPALAVIGPDQNALQVFWGEEWRYDLYSLIRETFDFYKEHDWNSNPIPQLEHSAPKDAHSLHFPTDIALYHGGYCVSDTARHRLVIFSDSGEVRHLVGADSGFADGKATEARFCYPRGLCTLDNMLYIADSGNHAIRALDLESMELSTLSGLGDLGQDYAGGDAKAYQHLASPWDLCADERGLWVAMAGTQQIWRYEFATQHCFAFSGTGKALSLDGRSPETSSWKQPAALCHAQGRLFVCESMGNSVGALDLADGYTHRLPISPLSSPAGICHIPEKNALAIADSEKAEITLYYLDSKRSEVLDTSGLVEPVGLTWSPANQQLYIVDSGAHKLRFLTI